jgi:hypothetical protein
MTKECENCIYYVLEPDIDSSYYMCDNKNYKSSWPEFKGDCPYLKLKLDAVYKELVDLKKYYHNGKFALIGERRFQALSAALEIIKRVKEEDYNVK